MSSATYGEGWTSRVTGVRTDRRLEAERRPVEGGQLVRIVWPKAHRESPGQTLMAPGRGRHGG